jgi:uncharacterized membrane protein
MSDRKTSITIESPPNDLEATMQKLALVVSLVGLALMMGGFAIRFFNHLTWSLPGVSVLPLAMLLHPGTSALGLEAMSAGIVLLALLPTARVLLALWLYLRQRNWLNSLAALVVLVELLISMRAGS